MPLWGATDADESAPKMVDHSTDKKKFQQLPEDGKLKRVLQ